MTPGLTFDTGALIALERRRFRMAKVFGNAVADGTPITVPTVVVAEWWRGRSQAREVILRGVRVDETPLATARLAGEAIASVPGASVVDAIVMASAAQRGDVVYTSDPEDLERLRAVFPAVRVLRV